MTETEIKENNKQRIMPTLTGDILYQNRIHQALEDFRTASENKNSIDTILSRLGAVEALYIEAYPLLDDEQEDNYKNALERCHDYVSTISKYVLTQSRTEDYRNALSSFLSLTTEIMRKLYKIIYLNGHIIKLGKEANHGRR